MNKLKLAKLNIQKIVGMVVIVLIAIEGVHLLISSHAQSPYASARADQGTLTAPATTEQCSGSSDGMCVQFGQQQTLVQPSIPTTSIYLGAWLNTSGSAGSGNISNALSELPAFNQSIGRSLSIVHIYTSFTSPLPTSALTSIDQDGAIPLISWSCGDVSAINSGADDSIITDYATGLKAYAKPVFLRWYWEMNLNNSFSQACGGYNNGPAYVTAWQHIWNIFNNVGANNVAFVWNPGVSGGDAAPYYPGDKYVDWIGFDGYDRSQDGSTVFSSLFTSYYNEWVSHDKPIMIGETGAMTVDQAQYIQGMQQDLPTDFPQIKAVVYWDATGSAGSWVLQGSGLSAFQSMSLLPYFSYN